MSVAGMASRLRTFQRYRLVPPIVYTNGPVGNILPGEAQTWASEVTNRSGQSFRYRQIAPCATTRRIPVDDDSDN